MNTADLFFAVKKNILEKIVVATCFAPTLDINRNHMSNEQANHYATETETAILHFKNLSASSIYFLLKHRKQ